MVKAELTEKQKMLLCKQQYGLAGEHSAVKLCTWMKKSLCDEGFCYKQKFYGISSHLCLQCTPIVNWCSQNCSFCWRIGNFNLPSRNLEWEEPREILDKMIEQQRRLMNGFPGNPKINMNKFREAQNPKHVAISLSGEPTAFPKLSDFLKEIHKRGMTSFVVTNGTYPENIKKLKELPTQLYITLAAPDKKTYLKLCKPMIKNGWERIIKTLKLLPKIETRKVIRLTLIRGRNMHSPEKYAELIKIANPHFVEAKGYMAVGFSRERVGMGGMPLHEEIVLFSKKLSELLGWKIIDEQKESRVCLIAKEDYKWRKNLKK